MFLNFFKRSKTKLIDENLLAEQSPVFEKKVINIQESSTEYLIDVLKYDNLSLGSGNKIVLELIERLFAKIDNKGKENE